MVVKRTERTARAGGAAAWRPTPAARRWRRGRGASIDKGAKTNLFKLMKHRGRTRLTSSIWARALDGGRPARDRADRPRRRGARCGHRVGGQPARRRGGDHRRRARGPLRGADGRADLDRDAPAPVQRRPPAGGPGRRARRSQRDRRAMLGREPADAADRRHRPSAAAAGTFSAAPQRPAPARTVPIGAQRRALAGSCPALWIGDGAELEEESHISAPGSTNGSQGARARRHAAVPARTASAWRRAAWPTLALFAAVVVVALIVLEQRLELHAARRLPGRQRAGHRRPGADRPGARWARSARSG